MKVLQDQRNIPGTHNYLIHVIANRIQIDTVWIITNIQFWVVPLVVLGSPYMYVHSLLCACITCTCACSVWRSWRGCCSPTRSGKTFPPHVSARFVCADGTCKLWLVLYLNETRTSCRLEVSCECVFVLCRTVNLTDIT